MVRLKPQPVQQVAAREGGIEAQAAAQKAAAGVLADVAEPSAPPAEPSAPPAELLKVGVRHPEGTTRIEVQSDFTIAQFKALAVGKVPALSGMVLQVTAAPGSAPFDDEATIASAGIRKGDMVHVRAAPDQAAAGAKPPPSSSKTAKKAVPKKAVPKKAAAKKAAPKGPAAARKSKAKRKRQDVSTEEEDEEDIDYDEGVDEIDPQDRIKFGAHAGPATSQRATLHASEGVDPHEIARSYLNAGADGISGAAAYDQFTAAARVQAATAGKVSFEERRIGNRMSEDAEEDVRPIQLMVTFMGDRRKQVEEECPGYSQNLLIDIFAAILEKRTTSKRRRTAGGVTAGDRLLAPAEMAARSPGIFWSTMRACEGQAPLKAINHVVELARPRLEQPAE